MRLICSSVYFYFALVFFSDLSVLASNKVGNGGNLVVCENKSQKIQSATLLDFYEDERSSLARVVSNIKNEFKNKTPEQIAEIQLSKLKVASPKLTDQYLKRLKEFLTEIEYKDDIVLTPIPDSFHLFKPKNKFCKIEQLAIRKNVISVGEKRFLINNDLWKKMTSVQQAGLYTHEIIYEHFSKLGEENSIKARKVNRYLYSSNINSKDFWSLTKELELPIYP
jgi:hypothetical protein